MKGGLYKVTGSAGQSGPNCLKLNGPDEVRNWNVAQFVFAGLITVRLSGPSREPGRRLSERFRPHLSHHTKKIPLSLRSSSVYGQCNYNALIRVCRRRRFRSDGKRVGPRRRSRLGKQRQEALRKGLEYFQQSVALDRLYAPAYSGMADAYSLLANYGGMPPNEAFPRAKSSALEALDLDHTLAEGHNSLAYVQHHFEWDWAGAEEEWSTSNPSNSITATPLRMFAMRNSCLMKVVTMRRFAKSDWPLSWLRDLW
jgi:hypothetical protein